MYRASEDSSSVSILQSVAAWIAFWNTPNGCLLRQTSGLVPLSLYLCAWFLICFHRFYLFNNARFALTDDCLVAVSSPNWNTIPYYMTSSVSRQDELNPACCDWLPERAYRYHVEKIVFFFGDKSPVKWMTRSFSRVCGQRRSRSPSWTFFCCLLGPISVCVMNTAEGK